MNGRQLAFLGQRLLDLKTETQAEIEAQLFFEEKARQEELERNYTKTKRMG